MNRMLLIALLLSGCATDAEFYAPNPPPRKHATWKEKVDARMSEESRRQVMDQALRDMMQTHRTPMIDPTQLR